ncbi:uncharacterized protein LOC141518043 [Macrotis lagotis]|uniref:uncharacterized protein LOC141518043 n=1 Tax=Macrotis lagotis TaxID=92651 RepID=UPI003D689E01
MVALTRRRWRKGLSEAREGTRRGAAGGDGDKGDPRLGGPPPPTTASAVRPGPEGKMAAAARTGPARAPPPRACVPWCARAPRRSSPFPSRSFVRPSPPPTPVRLLPPFAEEEERGEGQDIPPPSRLVGMGHVTRKGCREDSLGVTSTLGLGEAAGEAGPGRAEPHVRWPVGPRGGPGPPGTHSPATLLPAGRAWERSPAPVPGLHPGDAQPQHQNLPCCRPLNQAVSSGRGAHSHLNQKIPTRFLTK